jgi:hypothetical protein
LPGGTARRGQNFAGKKRCRRVGPEVCTHLARRHAGRSGNSRPSQDLRGRLARPDIACVAPRGKPQPGDPARRNRQGGIGFSRRSIVGIAGSFGSGAEQHVHGSLPGHAVRFVARAVHHHRELAGPDPSRVARPVGSHRIARLHRVRETANRPAIPGAAAVGGKRARPQTIEDSRPDAAQRWSRITRGKRVCGNWSGR